MKIDIWSDVVCPWCYLGAVRFDAAMEQLPFRDELDIRWRAYQLDPEAPREPQDLRATLERKYGPGAFDTMTTRLTRLGENEGIDYRFDLTQRVNTFDAHRLVAFANALQHGQHGQHDDPTAKAPNPRNIVNRLFRAYFTEGENLADQDRLVQIAAGEGMEPTAVAEMLAGDSFTDVVTHDIDQARGFGLSGVPAFVVEERWLISGAQEVDTIVDALTGMHDQLVH